MSFRLLQHHSRLPGIQALLYLNYQLLILNRIFIGFRFEPYWRNCYKHFKQLQSENQYNRTKYEIQGLQKIAQTNKPDFDGHKKD